MKTEKKSLGKIASIKNFFSKVVNFITELPGIIMSLIQKGLNDVKLVRKNMKDMTNSNINVGIYHMESKNWKDAILRFNFVRNFLDKGNKKAIFYLAWCNLFMGNKDKALDLVNESLEKPSLKDKSENQSDPTTPSPENHMNDADEQELHMMKLELKEFIETMDELDAVPENIEKFTRNILAEDFVDRINSKDYYLPTEFVNEINNHIVDFPDSYRVLELGSNIGALSLEMRKRMPDEFHLTCVEGSDIMMLILEKELTEFAGNNQNVNLYELSDLREQFVREYLDENYEENGNVFDLIVSFDGFGFTKDLKQVFLQIHHMLKAEGSFAFTTRVKNVSSNLSDSLASKSIFEFTHEADKLKSSLKESGFALELERNVELSKNNLFAIFIARKI